MSSKTFYRRVQMNVSNLRRIGALAIFSAFISMGYASAHAEVGAAGAPGMTSAKPEAAMAPGHMTGEKGEAMRAEMKERMAKEREEVRAACEKEPARCKEIRQAHREKMREQLCAENPEQCAKMKARREEMQKQCAADPKACEAKKAEAREKMKERMEQGREQRMESHESMAKPGGTAPDKK
jgi:Skp family chaperone for outer membrane proteins